MVRVFHETLNTSGEATSLASFFSGNGFFLKVWGKQSVCGRRHARPLRPATSKPSPPTRLRRFDPGRAGEVPDKLQETVSLLDLREMTAFGDERESAVRKGCGVGTTVVG